MFKFNSLYFFISFCIGLFLVYIITPYPEVIYTFPTPDNLDIIYNNYNKSCYKYNATEVECNENTIKTPIYKNKKLF